MKEWKDRKDERMKECKDERMQYDEKIKGWKGWKDARWWKDGSGMKGWIAERLNGQIKKRLFLKVYVQMQISCYPYSSI